MHSPSYNWATSDSPARPTATKHSADMTVPNMIFCHLLDVFIFSRTLTWFQELEPFRIFVHSWPTTSPIQYPTHFNVPTILRQSTGGSSKVFGTTHRLPFHWIYIVLRMLLYKRNSVTNVSRYSGTTGTIRPRTQRYIPRCGSLHNFMTDPTNPCRKICDNHILLS